jgi:uncharacterized membrane protein YjfL (UPF0719 family)
MGHLALGLGQLLAAVILSAVVAFLSFYLLQWFTRGLDEWEELRKGNVAVGLVLGTALVAVAMILRPALAVDPAAWDVGRQIYLRALLAGALQVVLGLILAALALVLALLIFSFLTRGIDEIEELKKGNVAVGGLLAGVVIGVGLMVSQSVGQIMSAVVSFLL